MTVFDEDFFSKLVFQASQAYGGGVVKWPLKGIGLHCRHFKPRCQELPRLAAPAVGHPGRCWRPPHSLAPNLRTEIQISAHTKTFCSDWVLHLWVLFLCLTWSVFFWIILRLLMKSPVIFVNIFRSTNCGTTSWSLWRLCWKKMWGITPRGTRGILWFLKPLVSPTRS